MDSKILAERIKEILENKKRCFTGFLYQRTQRFKFLRFVIVFFPLPFKTYFFLNAFIPSLFLKSNKKNGGFVILLF